MNESVIKHDDERRVLTEWISDFAVKRCKIIEVKGKVTLGNHYHNNNDSIFYIFKGKANYTLKDIYTGEVDKGWMFEGDKLFVPRGIIHTFILYEGSIMMEAATEKYDKEDEIQVTE